MKTDYNKIGGCVVNMDVSDEYTTAINRRKRQIAINKMLREHDKLTNEVNTMRNEIDELKQLINKLINISN